MTGPDDRAAAQDNEAGNKPAEKAPTRPAIPEAPKDAPAALADDTLDQVSGGNYVMRNPKSPFE